MMFLAEISLSHETARFAKDQERARREVLCSY
jgi:hypothetical protein